MVDFKAVQEGREPLSAWVIDNRANNQVAYDWAQLIGDLAQESAEADKQTMREIALVAAEDDTRVHYLVTHTWGTSGVFKILLTLEHNQIALVKRVPNDFLNDIEPSNDLN